VLRAIRGATTAATNEAEAILTAVRELLLELVAANQMGADRLVCAFFSATPDLDAAFPARAARELGWTDVALFGMQELAVKGAPERCVRVMLLVHDAGAPGRDERTHELHHVYLRGAKSLRPDLATPRTTRAATAQVTAPGVAEYALNRQGGGGGAPSAFATSLFGGFFTFYYL